MSKKLLVLPIILTMLLSGCGINVQATQPKKTPKTLPVTSVKEIAYQCGFEDPNYFCKVFKKEYQCSPLEFKNKEMPN